MELGALGPLTLRGADTKGATLTALLDYEE